MKTKFKWSMSGTPLQNRVGELYSLIRFLAIEPFSNYFCTKCDCKTFSWQFSDNSHCDACSHKPMKYAQALKAPSRLGQPGKGFWFVG